MLAAIAQNIQFQAAISNIDLKVNHIPGKVNVIADLLLLPCYIDCSPIIIGLKSMKTISPLIGPSKI